MLRRRPGGGGLHAGTCGRSVWGRLLIARTRLVRMLKIRIFSGLWRGGHSVRREKFSGDEMEARSMRAITFLRYETRRHVSPMRSAAGVLYQAGRKPSSHSAHERKFLSYTACGRAISERLTDAEAGDVSDHLPGVTDAVTAPLPDATMRISPCRSRRRSVNRSQTRRRIWRRSTSYWPDAVRRRAMSAGNSARPARRSR